MFAMTEWSNPHNQELISKVAGLIQPMLAIFDPRLQKINKTPSVRIIEICNDSNKGEYPSVTTACVRTSADDYHYYNTLNTYKKIPLTQSRHPKSIECRIMA